MKTKFCLETIKIPAEFQSKTAFIFEVEDESFTHLGIEAETVALVDNSKEFSTTIPIAFILRNERMIGKAQKVVDDLYLLKTGNETEQPILFTQKEITMIGQLRGFYKLSGLKTELTFEKI